LLVYTLNILLDILFIVLDILLYFIMFVFWIIISMSSITVHFPGYSGDIFSYFDLPLLDPPRALPPYTGGPPTLAGELDPKMEGKPLKEFCALISGLSIEEAEDLVDFGAMWVDNRQKVDPLFPLPKVGEFRLNYPSYGPIRFYEVSKERIVYEDEDIFVYNKESGRPSQAVPHDAYNNVLSGFVRLSGLFLRLPHRIDAGTSGLLVIAKNRKSAGAMGKAFQQGKVKKRYVALCAGEMPDWKEKEVTAPIAKNAGKLIVRENGPGISAKTDFKVLGGDKDNILIQATPYTGRTHQIRLHLSFLGIPIQGDNFYGGIKSPRLMLKAAGLAFPHPKSGKVMVLGDTWEES
jgi:RluA family pseudouridine synthase